jgi:hypothetical protein
LRSPPQAQQLHALNWAKNIVRLAVQLQYQQALGERARAAATD